MSCLSVSPLLWFYHLLFLSHRHLLKLLLQQGVWMNDCAETQFLMGVYLWMIWAISFSRLPPHPTLFCRTTLQPGVGQDVRREENWNPGDVGAFSLSGKDFGRRGEVQSKSWNIIQFINGFHTQARPCHHRWLSQVFKPMSEKGSLLHRDMWTRTWEGFSAA